MRTTLLIIFSLLLTSCSTKSKYLEVNKPFKNYSEDISPFIPLNANKNTVAYRIWLLESKSIDRLLTIYKSENNEYKSELLEFGEKYSKNNKKEIFNSTIITPKSGHKKVIQFIESELAQIKSEKFMMEEVAFDESILNYIIEWKDNGENSKIEKITIPKSLSNSLELVNFIKSEYNIE